MPVSPPEPENRSFKVLAEKGTALPNLQLLNQFREDRSYTTHSGGRHITPQVYRETYTTVNGYGNMIGVHLVFTCSAECKTESAPCAYLVSAMDFDNKDWSPGDKAKVSIRHANSKYGSSARSAKRC